MLYRVMRAFAPLCLVAVLADCGGAPGEDVAESADSDLSVHRDDLNGIWIASRNGVASPEPAVIEAWKAIGVRLDLGGETFALTPSGARLKATTPAIALTSHPNDPATFGDDTIDGTIAGEPILLTRDVSPKPPITLSVPGDRPFRSFLFEELAPAAQRDRESYVAMRSSTIRTFLHSCVLYKKSYWGYKFLAGDDGDERDQSLENIITAVEGASTTPRQMIYEPKFAAAVNANVRFDWLGPRARSELGLYFSTAAGRSVRIPITSDSLIYFITDRPERAETLGLVLTKTPLHAPYAAPFSQQLLDMGAMTSAEDGIYARAMMDLLTRSDARRASQLSPAGRSAITDWYGIMAIEDYRSMAFGHPEIAWGYNLTNVQFYGLVARALARPAARDADGDPVLGQVIVGNELRPGDPSYADVLNDGKDMQELRDMAALKQLATYYLLQTHPSAVRAVVDAFAGIVPGGELDNRARYDIFHFICAQLYDNKGRSQLLSASAARDAVDAVGTLIDLLHQESAQFEAYIVASGFTRSDVRAPKANGI